jgi:hypothetical protein
VTAVAVRLVRLHAASRRVPAALVMLAACAAALRGTLYGHWDSYGSLCAAAVFAAGLAAITIRGPRAPAGG